MLPAFLTGAASIVVSVAALKHFLESSKTGDQRKAYLRFAKQTLVARGTHLLSQGEVEEATRILKDIKNLQRTAIAGWKSKSDHEAFERTVAYVPAARAKFIVDRGIAVVDKGIASVIKGLESIRSSTTSSVHAR